MSYYKALNKNVWQGRVDSTEDTEAFRFHQVVRRLDLSESDIGVDPKKKNISFLGFCSDIGIRKNFGRDGAASAPDFIRAEMSNLPKSFSDNVQIYDAGNIISSNDDLEELQSILAFYVKRMLDLEIFPIILGGGHELAYGHYNGIKAHIKNGEGRIGIINLDAHFDLRPYRENGPNSGTMFLQIADDCEREARDFNYLCIGIQEHANTISLFKKAKGLNAEYILAKDINNNPHFKLFEKLDRFVNKVDYIYLTLCSDVFSSAFAPGVSASQPFGLDPELVLHIIKHVGSSTKLTAFDIAEISPRFDEDSRTAKLGAITIFALINTIIGSEKIFY